MSRMDDIENKVVNALLRLSNLEETKARMIESAIMVKNEVFCGHNDISALCLISLQRNIEERPS